MRGGSKWGFMMMKTLENKTLLYHFPVDITNESDENPSPIFFRRESFRLRTRA